MVQFTKISPSFLAKYFIAAKTALVRQFEKWSENRHVESGFTEIKPSSVVRHLIVAKAAFLGQIEVPGENGLSQSVATQISPFKVVFSQAGLKT